MDMRGVGKWELKTIKAGKLTEKDLCSDVVSVGGVLFTLEVTELVGFYRRQPTAPLFDPANSLVSRRHVGPLAIVRNVLAAITNTKIRFPVVQLIAVEVVDLFVYGIAHNNAVHIVDANAGFRVHATDCIAVRCPAPCGARQVGSVFVVDQSVSAVG